MAQEEAMEAIEKLSDRFREGLYIKALRGLERKLIRRIG